MAIILWCVTKMAPAYASGERAIARWPPQDIQQRPLFRTV